MLYGQYRQESDPKVVTCSAPPRECACLVAIVIVLTRQGYRFDERVVASWTSKFQNCNISFDYLWIKLWMLKKETALDRFMYTISFFSIEKFTSIWNNVMNIWVSKFNCVMTSLLFSTYPDEALHSNYFWFANISIILFMHTKYNWQIISEIWYKGYRDLFHVEKQSYYA